MGRQNRGKGKLWNPLETCVPCPRAFFSIHLGGEGGNCVILVKHLKGENSYELLYPRLYWFFEQGATIVPLL